MLENAAIKLLYLAEGLLMLLGFALVVAGFVVGLIARQGATLSLRRVPYFIWTAAIYGLFSALQLAWLLIFEALQNGVLWILVAVMLSSIFAVGVVYGVLGHARSINTYGDGSRAWMAMVPFVNLVLLFKRPLNWEKSGLGAFTLNALGVIFGIFLLLIGAGLGKVAEEKTSEMARQSESDPAMQVVGVDLMVRGQGLEATLIQLAAEVPGQQVLDESTTLLRVEGVGTTLRYVYEVSTDALELPESMRDALLSQNCNFQALRPVIDAGATIEHLYTRRDGSEWGTVTITRQICQY